MLYDEFKNKLPLQDFEKLGLYKDNDLKVSQPDLLELLAGRRSDFIELKNLEHDGIFIDKLKAKLSIVESSDGTRSLNVHPVYKNPQSHALLNDKEMKELIDGEKANFNKSYTNNEGKKSKMIIEFDKDTNEFVSLDTNRVLIPDMVNNEKLSPAQKAKLKEGEEVSLNDGTNFQASPTAKKGVRSDRAFLILSVLLDGGVSYLVVKGAAKLLGKGKDQEQSAEYSQGYKDAEKKMEDQKWANKNSNLINFSDDHHKRDLDEQTRQRQGKQESRGYSRSGISR